MTNHVRPHCPRTQGTVPCVNQNQISFTALVMNFHFQCGFYFDISSFYKDNFLFSLAISAKSCYNDNCSSLLWKRGKLL